jgi:hypothetical protein
MPECQKQVHVLAMRASQDVRLDEPLADACYDDRAKLCDGVQPVRARAPSFAAACVIVLVARAAMLSSCEWGHTPTVACMVVLNHLACHVMFCAGTCAFRPCLRTENFAQLSCMQSVRQTDLNIMLALATALAGEGACLTGRMRAGTMLRRAAHA